MVDLHQSVGGRTGNGYCFIVFVCFFAMCFWSFLFSCPLGIVVILSVFFSLFSFCLVALSRSYWCIEIVMSMG